MELPFAFGSDGDHESPPSSIQGSPSYSGSSAAATLPSGPPRYANAPGGGGAAPPPPRYDNVHPDHFYPPPAGHDSYASPGSSMMTYDLGSSSAAPEQAGGGDAKTAPPATAEPIDDFADTFVTVCESDAEEGGDGSDVEDDDVYIYDSAVVGGNGYQRALNGRYGGGDVLALLLSGDASPFGGDGVLSKCEEANSAAREASDATGRGDMEAACVEHTRAARAFRDAAVTVKKADPFLAHSLLLLSNSQARSAEALHSVVKSRAPGTSSAPSKGCRGAVGSSPELDPEVSSDPGVPASDPRQERLRATIRGALGTKREADMTDSVFLGTAVGNRTVARATAENKSSATTAVTQEELPDGQTITDGELEEAASNPVDDMMKLERELRDMDMALEMGNSVASLGARTNARVKNSSLEEAGSFCVVPPGSSSASYMSSSVMWSPSGVANRPQHEHRASPAMGTVPAGAGVRARANRVQNILDAATTSPAGAHKSHGHGAQGHHPPPATSKPGSGTPSAAQSRGLESSWWGHASAVTHMGASIVSAGGSGRTGMGQHGHTGQGHNGHHDSTSSPSGGASAKELMRLLDTIRTLGDENAVLLREVEAAQGARHEAKAAREQMRQFKMEYGKRFATLKAALEKFRRQYPEGPGKSEQNPVLSSDFVRSTSVSEVHKKDQMIRKLAADLKKEKEESRKKDAALRKYESFYREVKARSAQKARQRQQEQQQQQQQLQKQQKSKVEINRSSR